MTPEDVQAAVSAIDAKRWDDEAAHGDEDALWEAVLVAIANDAESPKLLAQEALKTRSIDFHRWCA